MGNSDDENDDMAMFDNSSISSFEDLGEMFIVNIQKIRNFTEQDVMVTLRNEKHKGEGVFKNGDTIMIQKDDAEGVDMSDSIKYYQTSSEVLLLEIQQTDSQYKYQIFS